MLTKTNSQSNDTLVNSALNYLGEGMSVLPINMETKRPSISWKQLQKTPASEEQMVGWLTQLIRGGTKAGIGLVTGAVSGIVVVDADTPEAVQWCKDNGLTSPFAVKTTRGMHYYFKHPGPHLILPNVSHNKIRGFGLYGVPRLDFRGDGGYVIAPPSIRIKSDGTIHQYEWEPTYLDWDDMPVWQQRTFTSPTKDDGTWDLSALDLSSVPIQSPMDHLPIWEQAELQVKTHGKFDEGDGRNDMMIRFAGEQVRLGVINQDLVNRCIEFQEAFFATPLDKEEFVATLRSAQQMDRRNHPQDYLPDGSRVQKHTEPATKPIGLVPIYGGDDAVFDAMLPKDPPLIEPLVPAGGSIIMLYAWTGHGKSNWLFSLMWHTACGRTFGGLEPTRPCRILYLDYENGPRTLTVRRNRLIRSVGNPGKNLAIWLRAKHAPESGDMNLRTKEGVARLGAWIDATSPEIVVIDTLRSAWPGLEENKAEAWAPINELLLRLRAEGKTVIIVHHANKPNQDGHGKEAGSSNQLTVIESHIHLMQLFDTEEKAQKRRGKCAPDTWSQLLAKAQASKPGSRLAMAVEIDYEKLRDPTDNHSSLAYGFAFGPGGEPFIVGQSSPKQKAILMYMSGMTALDIAQSLGVELESVQQWTGMKY
jgi:hypothetical protein